MIACMDVESFLQIQEIADVCQVFPTYVSAIRCSYDCYSHSVSDGADTTVAHSPLHQFIVSKVVSQEIGKQCLSVVKNGIYWRDTIGQLDEKLPCIHERLLPIRAVIYQLLCCPEVREYGQTKVKEFVCRQPVITKSCQPTDLERLRGLSYQQKIAILHSVLIGTISLPRGMRSLLTIAPIMDCEPANVGPVLTCTCFIFALRNDLLPVNYITPLLLACFHCSLGKYPPRLSARPGPTGVTIASQFMLLLEHAQWFLSLLGIYEFPLPSAVFQPYIYIPLHVTAFKLDQKEKFHNDDCQAKEHYTRLSKDKAFVDFQRCICDPSASDNIGAVAVEYAKARDKLSTLLS